MGNSIRARIRSGHYYYNLVTTSFTCSGLQRCCLSSTLVSAGWCVVLPGMSISLLIIVGYECAPGQLVCITPVQLAAKLQSGLIVSMRFRSDRSCHLFLGGGSLKLADIHTSCVHAFYSDLEEITSLFQKDTVYCFFSTNNTSPCGCVQWFLLPFIELSEYYPHTTATATTTTTTANTATTAFIH